MHVPVSLKSHLPLNESQALLFKVYSSMPLNLPIHFVPQYNMLHLENAQKGEEKLVNLFKLKP